MPTYVYKFIDTGETIEVQQAFTDDALTEALHPDGRMMKVKKVFTPVGVTFKGGGFYKTDSRGAAKSGAAKTESATTASDAGTGSPTPAPSTASPSSPAPSAPAPSSPAPSAPASSSS